MLNKIDSYQIVEKLEETNYAIIYKVNSADRVSLALKIARRNDVEFNGLISREYRILSQFKHPNIVSVFDYSIARDRRSYFTLEYVSGQSINKYFKGFSEDFISAILQVINGLASFHNKGFVHSDIKPENILYDSKENRAVLIDFGFASIPSQSTRIGGTISYTAPEVIKGSGIDHRSDLYSLGVIIFETVSGEKFREEHLPIENIPEEIKDIIIRLVSKEPAIRPNIPEIHRVFSRYVTSEKTEIPSYKVRLPHTGFVGNSEIVEQLLSTKGEAVIINGKIGSGKTRLLHMQRRRM
jgi:serine/threonine protein kinase